MQPTGSKDCLSHPCGLLDILKASANSTFRKCGCKCCMIVDKALACVRLAMHDAGLTNACLMQSVILSEMLSRVDVPSMVVVGYLTFSGVFSIRHVWVHVPGNEHKKCPRDVNFTVDALMPSESISLMQPTYNLTLPPGTDLLDNDEDSIEQSRELEGMLSRVCAQSHGLTTVVQPRAVVTEVVGVQDLWKPVLRATRTEHLLK